MNGITNSPKGTEAILTLEFVGKGPENLEDGYSTTRQNFQRRRSTVLTIVGLKPPGRHIQPVPRITTGKM